MNTTSPIFLVQIINIFKVLNFECYFPHLLINEKSLIYSQISETRFSRFLRFLGYFLTSEKIRELISLLNFVAIEFFSRFLANFSTLVFISFVFAIFFRNFHSQKITHFSLHVFFHEFWRIIAFLLSSRSFLRFFVNLT